MHGFQHSQRLSTRSCHWIK